MIFSSGKDEKEKEGIKYKRVEMKQGKEKENILIRTTILKQTH